MLVSDITMDTETAINRATSDKLNTNYSVGMLRKAQDQQRLEGRLAVGLIEQAGQLAQPQMTKTSDGHISVRA
jgi:hypothetical protein